MKRLSIKPAYVVAGMVSVFFTIGLILRFSPLYAHSHFHELAARLQDIQHHAWALPAIVLLYMISGLILFAHVVLLWSTVFAFDPWHAVLYCETGSLASAFFLYGLGRVLRPELVRRLAGTYIDNVSQALGKRGKTTIILLHWFPICPFSVLNFLAGSTHIEFMDFAIGTVVGITPGIFFISFFGDRVRETVHHPHWQAITGLLLFIALAAVVFHQARRRFVQKV